MDNITFSQYVTKGVTFEEKDNRRIVKGHITAEVVDRQNEFIAIEETLNVLKTYMEVNPVISDWHSNRMVGKLLSYEKSEIEGHPSIYATVEVYKKDGVSLYDSVWEKILKGEYKGFSLGGASKNREPIVKDGKLVMNLKNLELYEIALCPYPANQFAVIDYVNDFAKAANLGIMNNDGRQRIQCNSVVCEIEKSAINSDVDADIDNTGGDNQIIVSPLSKEFAVALEKQVKEIIAREHELLGQKPDKKEEKVHDQLQDEFKKEDNINVPEGQGNVYKSEKDTLNNNMSQDTQTEIKKNDEVSTTKDHSTEISLLATLVKSHDETLAAISKNVATLLEKVEKAQDANPVAHGATAEAKPAVSDDKDVGAPAGNITGYAPAGNAQAGIESPAGAAPGTDSVSKSDDKKEEEKKEEVKKSEPAQEIKKSSKDGYVYEVVKAARPKYGIFPEVPQGAPTGAEILKAINSGWGGKYTNYEGAFVEAYQRLLKGEFGTGLPMGVVG